MGATRKGDTADQAAHKKVWLCAFYTKVLGDALSFMHKHNIIHRGACASLYGPLTRPSDVKVCAQQRPRRD